MFTGEITTRQFHPLMPTGEYEEIADGVMFYRWFANVTAAKTSEGLVLIDTGAYFNQQATLELICASSRPTASTPRSTPMATSIMRAARRVFLEEARSRNVARPRIVGQKRGRRTVRSL